MRIGRWLEFDSTDSWVESSSNAIFDTITSCLKDKSSVWIALSGGSTPFPVYDALAKQIIGLDPKQQANIHLLLVDERSVPFTDKQNNGANIARVFRNTSADIHLMTSPEDAANAAYHYSQYLNNRSLDILVLGMGDDGHTASLFPGTQALNDTSYGYIVSLAPAEPKVRITMTYAVAQSAVQRLVLIKGKHKRAMIEQLMEGEHPDWPIDKLLSDKGNPLTWYWTL
jgi:6-phosphogluconolactonase